VRSINVSAPGQTIRSVVTPTDISKSRDQSVFDDRRPTLETRHPDESSIPLGRMQRVTTAAVTPGIGVGTHFAAFVSADPVHGSPNIRRLRHSVAATPVTRSAP